MRRKQVKNGSFVPRFPASNNAHLFVCRERKISHRRDTWRPLQDSTHGIVRVHGARLQVKLLWCSKSNLSAVNVWVFKGIYTLFKVTV